MSRSRVGRLALCVWVITVFIGQVGAVQRTVVSAGAGSPYQPNGVIKTDWGCDLQDPVTSGSRLEGLYDNSTELPTFSFLALARRSVDIEIYEMADPDFRAAIRQLLARRIQVRVIKDALPIGDACHYFAPVAATDNPDCQDQKRLVTEVQAAGGFFIPFNKATLCGPGTQNQECFEHGKMILVDDKWGLISSGNFNSTSFCNLRWNPAKCNRDYSYIVSDPTVVSTLRALFQHDLLGAPYDLPSLLTPAEQSKLTVSPSSLQPLIEFIRSARTSIVLQNQYLHEPTINAALMEAAHRGVQVYVMVASLCAYGPLQPGTAASATTQFEQFDAAGVHTRFFTSSMKVKGKPGYLHAKAIVIDGRFAWMGSINGSTTSVSLNREYGIFFKNPRMVAHLSQIMTYDFSNPLAETWQESLRCVKDQPSAGSGPE